MIMLLHNCFMCKQLLDKFAPFILHCHVDSYFLLPPADKKKKYVLNIYIYKVAILCLI